MSTIRVGKRRSYTVVYNDLLPQDGTLSARAWGIFVYLIGRPEGWETSSLHLAKVFKEGRDAIRTSLHELVAAGLMVEETQKIGNLPVKRFAIPDESQETGFQAPEKPSQTITERTNPGSSEGERTPLRRHLRRVPRTRS